MRLKTLLRYHFKTILLPIVLFFCFYMLGTLLSTGIALAVVGVSADSAEVSKNWSTSIISYIIFCTISGLLSSQKDARFLITRSVSRKEIFVSNALFMGVLAACMCVLQQLSIYIDGGVRALFGVQFVGIEADAQTLMAPDMTNMLMFALVSFAIFLFVATFSFLLGSLLARWKWPVIGGIIVLGIVVIGSFALPNAFDVLVDIVKFLIIDKSSGLWLALKYIGFSLAALAIAFPIHRGLTAAKQS